MTDGWVYIVKSGCRFMGFEGAPGIQRHITSRRVVPRWWQIGRGGRMGERRNVKVLSDGLGGSFEVY